MIEIEELIYAAASIIISIILLFTAKILFKTKLTNLEGTKKLLGLISIIIIIIEGVYLGLVFEIFELVSGVIASVGVAFALVTFALQNHLKNIVAGIGLYINPLISIGDLIEIEGNKGVIIEFHLMKTTALTEDGKHIFIPNLKFSESVTVISHKKDHDKKYN